MDAVHIHLMITHVPILATIFSLLILIWGVVRSDSKYQMLAMTGFIIAGIFSLVALNTGEGAEEAVEHLAGVTRGVIHTHEEAAEVANWIAMLLGVVSIGGFVIQKVKPALMKTYVFLVLLAGLVSSGAFSYVGYLGGQVRHTEIRSQTAASAETQASEVSERISTTNSDND